MGPVCCPIHSHFACSLVYLGNMLCKMQETEKNYRLACCNPSPGGGNRKISMSLMPAPATE